MEGVWNWGKHRKCASCQDSILIIEVEKCALGCSDTKRQTQWLTNDIWNQIKDEWEHTSAESCCGPVLRLCCSWGTQSLFRLCSENREWTIPTSQINTMRIIKCFFCTLSKCYRTWRVLWKRCWLQGLVWPSSCFCYSMTLNLSTVR